MKQLIKLALTLSALLLGQAASAQAFDEFSGHETFQRFCASCHGTGGEGDGPVASGLPLPVPDLTTLKSRYADDYDARLLRKIIEGDEAVIYHGTRFMPVWGYEFWVEEGADEAAEQSVEIIIRNLIDYIESIQR